MAKPGSAVIAIALGLAPMAALAQVGAPPIPPMPTPPMADVLPPLPAAPRVMAPAVAPPMAMPMTRSMPPMAMPPMAMPAQAMPAHSMPRQAMPAPAMPGGPGAYRPPSYGFALPRYWVAPTHYIADYRAYGLGRPAWGYGWSRYYDDFVLTDRWGRVYDWRSGDGYRGDDRRGDYDRGGPRKRDRSGIVGAIIGGAIGAVTGNLIAGAGSRLAGSLIGGGVGALAGQAIDRETSRHGRRDRDYGYDDGYRPDPRPHWDMGYWSGEGAVAVGGCGCTETVTTIVEPGRPIVTKKVTYVTEYVTVPARTKYVRTKYVPRGKYVRLD